MKKITFTVTLDNVSDANVDEVIEKVDIAIAKLHSGVIKAINNQIVCNLLSHTQQLYHIRMGDQILCDGRLNPGSQDFEPSPHVYPSAQAAWRKVAYLANEVLPALHGGKTIYKRYNRELTVVKAEG